MGTSSVGQGVETIYAQIAADALEVPMERIRHVYHGSTGLVSDGYGAYHSRSVVMGGSAVLDATQKFMGLLREAAGKRLGCAESSVTLDVDKVVGGGGSRCRSRNSSVSPPRARSSTTNTPTATEPMPRTSRSMRGSDISRFSITSWCRTSAAPSTRSRSGAK